MPQTVNLRVDSVNSSHVHCTLFMSGAQIGELVFSIGEYQIFGAALLMGIKQTMGHLIDRSDDQVFKDWIKRKAAETEAADANS